MDKRTKIVSSRAVSVFLTLLVAAETATAGGGGLILNPSFIYVDGVHGNDNNRGLTPATALATVQKAIEVAEDGDAVFVYPGLYRGRVDFQGKALMIQGVPAVAGGGIPVLSNPGDFVARFVLGEGPDSILTNFVIMGSFMAVFVVDGSPTISNLTIVENTFGIDAYGDSDPRIENCIFWNNAGGDLFGCRAEYSRLSDAGQGQGNITAAPLFVDPNSGDYHLFSERGRYWPEHDIWVLDRVTSPCVDTGDPNADPLDEPMPNGNRLNMGAYGGTMQASMSPERLPGRASNPSPPDRAVGIDTSAILSWRPGANAILHDVHFGTESPPPLVSNQAVAQFDPGRMIGNTVYYWRIDELDSQGNKAVGAIWQFTTSSPAPPKGRACFVPATGVWINGDFVSISEVLPGHSMVSVDAVAMSRDFPHFRCPGAVTQVQEHEGAFKCYDVALESGNRITVAENHYFLTESGKWLAVQNLRVGTRLQTATGSIAVAGVARRPLPYVGRVYNLNIEASDRYLVGKDAIVVRDY